MTADLQTEEREWVVDCVFDPPHTHAYPSDWQFGGASGTDPRADPRWRPDTYTYWSDKFELLHVTQVPKCDDEAIDYFTNVASFGPSFRPHIVQVTRHTEHISIFETPRREPITLPVRYNPDTDEAYDV